MEKTPTVIINGKEVELFMVKERWALNTTQSALYLGLTSAGFQRKAARLKLTSYKSLLREKETFYAIDDLNAIKDGTWKSE